eukprot:scpid85124/ scgid20590/ 
MRVCVRVSSHLRYFDACLLLIAEAFIQPDCRQVEAVLYSGHRTVLVQWALYTPRCTHPRIGSRHQNFERTALDVCSISTTASRTVYASPPWRCLAVMLMVD